MTMMNEPNGSLKLDSFKKECVELLQDTWIEDLYVGKFHMNDTLLLSKFRLFSLKLIVSNQFDNC